MADQPLPKPILSEEKLREFFDAFVTAIGDGHKLPLSITYRDRQRGVIPAGPWSTSDAELHSVDESMLLDGDKLVWLYVPEDNSPDDVSEILCQFPSPKIEYSEIKILPFKSKLSAGGKSVKRDREPTCQLAPTPPVTPTPLPHVNFAIPAQAASALRPGFYPILSQPTNATVSLGNDDVADALRGDKRKVEITAGLKIPATVAVEDAWMYPHPWLAWIDLAHPETVGRHAEWRSSVLQAQLALRADIVVDGKREQFEASKRSVCSLLLQQHVLPTTKGEWEYYFSSLWTVVSWFVFARTGFQGQDKFLFRVHKMWKDGFVDLVDAFTEATKGGQSQPPGKSDTRANFGRGNAGRKFRGNPKPQKTGRPP
jgi:hypothetical protein